MFRVNIKFDMENMVSTEERKTLRICFVAITYIEISEKLCFTRPHSPKEGGSRAAPS